MAGRTKGLKEFLVVWDASGVDSHGRVTVSDPRQERCRFEESIYDQSGQQDEALGADGIIYLYNPLKKGTIVWLGKMQNLPTGTSFREEDLRLMQVVDSRRIPDTRSRHVEHSATVVYYKDRLPTIV